jgi:hypothetical protein
LFGESDFSDKLLGAVDGIAIFDFNGGRADIITHEYGHFVLSRYLGDATVINACAPIYNHNFTEPTIRPACAWSEGWADFLQMAVQNDPDYVGRDFETPNSTYLPAPGEDPGSWEVVVAATLWDIFDPVGTEGGGFVDNLNDGLNGSADNGIYTASLGETGFLPTGATVCQRKTRFLAV